MHCRKLFIYYSDIFISIPIHISTHLVIGKDATESLTCLDYKQSVWPTVWCSTLVESHVPKTYYERITVVFLITKINYCKQLNSKIIKIQQHSKLRYTK